MDTFQKFLLILILGVVFTITAGVVATYWLAFHYGYTTAALPGSTGTYWVKPAEALK